MVGINLNLKKKKKPTLTIDLLTAVIVHNENGWHDVKTQGLNFKTNEKNSEKLSV